MKPLIYQSGTELVKAIPLTKSSPYRPLAIYELVVPYLNPGDILSLTAVGEVTNDTKVNLMFAHYISLLAGTTEIILTAKRGKNVDPTEHHWDWTDVGNWVSTIQARDVKIRLMAYTASSAYKTGMKLTVEQKQGQLSCLHFTA